MGAGVCGWSCRPGWTRTAGGSGGAATRPARRRWRCWGGCGPRARVIALDHTTVAALREHRDRQRAEAAAYGPGYHASGYVFTNLNGDPMAPDRLTRMFKKLTAQAGLPPVRLHDLRHGAASLALSAGMDLRVVQEMLGHSSIMLTANTYTSVLETT